MKTKPAECARCRKKGVKFGIQVCLMGYSVEKAEQPGRLCQECAQVVYDILGQKLEELCGAENSYPYGQGHALR